MLLPTLDGGSATGDNDLFSHSKRFCWENLVWESDSWALANEATTDDSSKISVAMMEFDRHNEEFRCHKESVGWSYSISAVTLVMTANF